MQLVGYPAPKVIKESQARKSLPNQDLEVVSQAPKYDSIESTEAKPKMLDKSSKYTSAVVQRKNAKFLKSRGKLGDQNAI